ncbi:MAG: DNA-methyltransferase [Cetobacterium sp.]
MNLKRVWSNEDGSIRLFNGDCLDVMGLLIENGIKVDVIITDPPYGITKNKWDSPIKLDIMWNVLYKLRKSHSTPIILFCAQPFTSNLIASNLQDFKYLKYWQKDRPSGFLNAKNQPLRDIEEIAVFYKKQCTYNPQMWEGKPSHSIGSVKGELECKNNNNYGNFARVEREGSQKYPRQLMKFNRPHPPIHPTQKPIELMEYLVKTYTNEGDTVLDFTMGSGTTGLACKNLNRKFIGIELDDKYFDIAISRIEEGK